MRCVWEGLSGVKTMGISYLLIVCYFVFTVLPEGEGYQKCAIPTGPAFSRAEYRLRGKTENLSSGVMVNHMTLIFISCKKDFVGDILQRQYTSVCKRGTWSPSLPNCKKFKRCGSPRVVDGAKSSEYNGKMTSFPHKYKVTYTCTDGKTLEGDNSVSCMDGKWTDINFRCVGMLDPIEQPETFCTAPPVKNIVYQPKQDIYSVNASVILQRCKNPRHTLDGDKALGCLEDGSWCGHAQCRPTRRCKPLRILRGVVLQRYTRVKAYCTPGNSISSEGLKIRCSDGVWVGKKPACRPTTCLLPRRKMNSLFVNKKTGQVARGRVQTGEVIQQFCTNGSPDDVTESKCSRGRWIPKFKSCPHLRSSRAQHLPCAIPDYILPLENKDDNFTAFEGQMVRSDQAIVPLCDRDISTNMTEAEGNPNLQESHCIGGVWIPQLPTCGIKCFPPEDVKVEPVKDVYSVEEEVKIVKCGDDNDVLVANSTLQCTASGSWSGEYECYQGTCLSPSDVIVEPSKPSYKVNEEVMVTKCTDKSLKLEAQSKLTCLPSGAWQGSFECKSDCSTRFTRVPGNGYISRRKAEFVDGVANSLRQCQEACVELKRIVCTGIEVIFKANETSHCALFQTTHHISEVYTPNEHSTRSIYVRGC